MANIPPGQQLNDLLVTRNFEPQALDASGKPSTSPAEATTFSFDYSGESGKDYGTVVVMLGEDNVMNVFFGDNVGKSMEGDDKKEWFDFLYQLRQFAKRNLLTFSLQNLNKLKYSMQGQAAIREGIFESWSGKRDVSYNADATQARLMIKHKRNIGENEARFRNIDKLFIETADGERFRLPFKSLSAGKAMLEHVRQGGTPYDYRGQHIVTIVTEMNLLSRFRRANQGKIFEGETAQLVEQATEHYTNLHHTLKSLSSKTGYTKYFESWNPADINDEDVIIEDLRHMFVEQNIDSRIEQALPLLARLKQETAMKEINVFEGWMNLLSEGTWALPDTPEKQQQLIGLLADELPVGPDATNATEQLYDLLGDDQLFDRLGELAEQDANADARAIVLERLEQMKSNPAVAQVIGKLKIESTPAAEQPVQEGENCQVCHKSTCSCDHEQVDKASDEELDEAIERISELSGTTLKNYIKKASSSSDKRSASNLASRAADKLAQAHNPGVEDDGYDDDHKSYMRSKGIGRAVDKLEELSKDTLGSYVKRASSDRAMKNFDQGVDMGVSYGEREPKFDVEKDRQDDNRRRGIHKAVNRLTREDTDEADYERRVAELERKGLTRSDAQGVVDAEMMQTKQVNELSPNTLKSYIKKAAGSAANKGAELGQKMAAADEVDRYTNRHMPNQSDERERMRGAVGAGYSDMNRIRSKANHRVKGIGRATDRLEEGGMSEADLLFQEIARGNVDIYNIYAHPKSNIEKFVSDQIHDRVEELSRERGIPMDDDIDKILQIIVDDLADDYGITDESVGGGNFLESTALTGQYGHSGKMQAVKPQDADMMDRIKFLAGIVK